MDNFFTLYNRSLLRELVITDFKLRYQGSWLGYAWSILKPLALFLILYIVFSRFVRFGDSISNYPVYLLDGIVLWSFFNEATLAGLSSIVGRESVVRRVNIPKASVVLSTQISAFINLCINLLVIFVFMAINSIGFRLEALWLIPLILELMVLVVGVSFFLSALYVRFRDISHLWEVGLQMAFYATPIIYPLALITNTSAQQVLLLSPVAQIIQDVRYVLITPDTQITLSTVPGMAKAIPYISVVIIFVLSMLYFKRHAPEFAEKL